MERLPELGEGEEFCAAVLVQLESLEAGAQLRFPAALSAKQRKAVHDLAQSLSLKHKSAGKGARRQVVVSTQAKCLEKLALLVSYFGSAYARPRGTQHLHESELGDPQLERFASDSVQGHLFLALDRLRGVSLDAAASSGLISYSALGRPPAFSSVGRTDKGAHAVANLMSVGIEPHFVVNQ